MKKGDFIHFTSFDYQGGPIEGHIWGVVVEPEFEQFKLFFNEPEAWVIDNYDEIQPEDVYSVVPPSKVPDKVLAEYTRLVLLNELTI